ncbi:SpoIID/LytB domain-containing protein, partial [bacterium]|nr:SpoIID/LytB domain-containing protein [bacterium]
KFQKEYGFGLTADVRSQVYSGLASEHPLAIQVVNKTKGMVITHSKELISTYYHSACGGNTLDSKDWLGKKVSFLKSKPCKWCSAYNNFHWSLDIPYTKLKNHLRLEGHQLSKIERLELKYSNAGRIKSLEVFHPKGTILISGSKLRKLMSPSIMRSTMAKEKKSELPQELHRSDEQAIMDILTRFKNHPISRMLKLEGRGFGHGVGLCQWGAKGLAKLKNSFRQILEYYYSDVEIVQTYY